MSGEARYVITLNPESTPGYAQWMNYQARAARDGLLVYVPFSGGVPHHWISGEEAVADKARSCGLLVRERRWHPPRIRGCAPLPHRR